MMRFRLDRLSLQARLLVATALILLVLYPLATSLFLAAEVRMYRGLVSDQVSATMKSLTYAISEQAVVSDYTTIEQMLRARVGHAPFSTLTYTDVDGGIVRAESKRIELQSPQWFEHWLALQDNSITTEVVLGGENYGTLQASITHLSFINQTWRDVISQAMIIGVAILILFGIMALTLRHGLRPLRQVADMAHRLKLGSPQMPQVPTAHAAPEIREMVETFNAAVQREVWLTQFAEITAQRIKSHHRFQQVLQLICARMRLDYACISYREMEGALQIPVTEGQGEQPVLEDWIDLADQVMAQDNMLNKCRVGVGRPFAYIGLPLQVASRAASLNLFRFDATGIDLDRTQQELLELCAHWLGVSLTEEIQGRQIQEQKERAEAVLNNAQEAIIMIDDKARIVVFNPAAESMFGYRQQQALGMPVCNLFLKLTLEAKCCKVTDVLDQRIQDLQQQHYGVRADGSEFPLELSFTTVRGMAEMRGVAVIRDITERLAAEQVVRRSEARLRRAQRVAQMGEWEYTPESGELVWSKELNEIFGLETKHQATYAEIVNMIHDEDRDRFRQAIQDAMSQGVVVEGEFRILRPDHTLRSVSVYAEPSFDDQGRRTSLFGVMQDITERKRAEAAVQSALMDKWAAEARNRSKSEFLANMSHELRTPLSAIISYSEMIEEEASAQEQPQQATDARQIRLAGEHLLNLINGILDLSKGEAGRLQLHLEEFDVASLIQEVSATVAPLVAKNNNQLSVLCNTDLGLMKSDMLKLRQILFNVLGNACKFTENGEIKLSVSRQEQDGVPWLVCSVSDTGIGMSPTQVARVFEPFVQADSATTKKYGGTGLGLAISRHYCHLLGGEMTVQSELSRGSVFSVKLPMAGQVQPVEEQEGGEAVISLPLLNAL